MSIYTYPKAIHEFERRLITAVNRAMNDDSQGVFDSIRFALYVDTSREGKPPSMRAEFVWHVMAIVYALESPINKSPSEDWIYWWQQRWRDRPNAPDFTGMMESSRRGLCVQLARYISVTDTDRLDTYLTGMCETIAQMLSQQQVSWFDIANMSSLLPMDHNSHSLNTPNAPFSVRQERWVYMWELFTRIHPQLTTMCYQFAMLVNTLEDFAHSLDDYFAANAGREDSELPETLFV